jgi:hypothetical protein
MVFPLIRDINDPELLREPNDARGRCNDDQKALNESKTELT